MGIKSVEMLHINTSGEQVEMELKTFGERLFWARHSHAKITQKKLRDRMEAEYGVAIGRNYISELEKATAEEEAEGIVKRPSFTVVRAMAGVMKVSLDFLAGFTESEKPVDGDGAEAAVYFSEEADEIAQIVDGLRPEQRAVIIALARNLSTVSMERSRREAEARDILESIERELGTTARQEVERIFREKGILNDG